MITRRGFVLPVASAAAGFLAAPNALGQNVPIQRGEPRWIWLRNNAGEQVAGVYRVGHDWNMDALRRIQILMRDLRENEQGPLPALLVEVLSLVQTKIGFSQPFQVTSGFRTARTNASLEGAAPASFHLHGMAADIIAPGHDPLTVALEAWAVARALGRCGLGLYDRFVHIDVGPQRTWTRLSR
jgi:uncharacterized protein YcbK (DUF882 family)